MESASFPVTYNSIHAVIANQSETTSAMDNTALYTIFFVCGNISTIISLIGVVGNVLNIAVLLRMIRNGHLSHANTPVYHLLLAMGVADLIVLICSTVYTLTMFTSWPPVLWQVGGSFIVTSFSDPLLSNLVF